MSAPTSNDGASSSRSEDPGPPTNGNTKNYPKPNYFPHGGAWESFVVKATVTVCEPGALTFWVTSDDEEWPTPNGGHEQEIGWIVMRDRTFLSMNAKYHLEFSRPRNSRDIIPYRLTDTHAAE